MSDKKHGQLKTLTEAHNKAVKDHGAAKKQATDQFNAAKKRQDQAKKYSGGDCNTYLPDTKIHSRCWTATKSELAANGELAKLAADDPGNTDSKSGVAFHTASQNLNDEITKLTNDPAKSRASSGGPSDDTKALYRYLIHNPESLPLYVALLLLVLLLDLAAIILKIGGFDSLYERRQGLRGWRSWWDTSSAEQLGIARAAATDGRRAPQGACRRRRGPRGDADQNGGHRSQEPGTAAGVPASAVGSRCDGQERRTCHRGVPGVGSRAAASPLDPRSPNRNLTIPIRRRSPDPELVEEHQAGDVLTGERHSWKLEREIEFQGGHAKVWRACDVQNSRGRSRSRSCRSCVTRWGGSPSMSRAHERATIVSGWSTSPGRSGMTTSWSWPTSTRRPRTVRCGMRPGGVA